MARGFSTTDKNGLMFPRARNQISVICKADSSLRPGRCSTLHPCYVEMIEPLHIALLTLRTQTFTKLHIAQERCSDMRRLLPLRRALHIRSAVARSKRCKDRLIGSGAKSRIQAKYVQIILQLYSVEPRHKRVNNTNKALVVMIA
jgi:hypothetical protein